MIDHTLFLYVLLLIYSILLTLLVYHVVKLNKYCRKIILNIIDYVCENSISFVRRKYHNYKHDYLNKKILEHLKYVAVLFYPLVKHIYQTRFQFFKVIVYRHFQGIYDNDDLENFWFNIKETKDNNNE